jgi:hypothetical protein
MEDKDEVVIVLLNMLEIVTRDIMDDEVPRYFIWLHLSPQVILMC